MRFCVLVPTWPTLAFKPTRPGHPSVDCQSKRNKFFFREQKKDKWSGTGSSQAGQAAQHLCQVILPGHHHSGVSVMEKWHNTYIESLSLDIITASKLEKRLSIYIKSFSLDIITVSMLEKLHNMYIELLFLDIITAS